MFDELVESSVVRKKTNTGWAVVLSTAVQICVLMVLILIPLIYTQALPKAMMATLLIAPPPPPPPPPPPAEAPKMSSVMLRGLSIRGIVQGDSVPDTFIPHLVELHMNGRFPFDKLVTKYPIEKINQAIEEQAAGKVVKPVFIFRS